MLPVNLRTIGPSPPSASTEAIPYFVPQDYLDVVPPLHTGAINDAYVLHDPRNLTLLSETEYANDSLNPLARIFAHSTFQRRVFCWHPPMTMLDVGPDEYDIRPNVSFHAWLERVARGDLAPTGIITPFWFSSVAPSKLSTWAALTPDDPEESLRRASTHLATAGATLLRSSGTARWYDFDSQRAMLMINMFPPEVRAATDARIVLRSFVDGAEARLEAELHTLGWVLERRRSK